MDEFLLYWVIPTVSSALACFGFTFLFNIHGIGQLICGVGGGLVWLI